ncbi:MAG: hypothetical protein CMP24_02175 [Rickettsiales bacterium]|nr:hypothetical protein [Rickettsiales bacterium]|tara:strand:+ start:87 stop:359 length:273 start_codon:yes stop_codon:yes gene_type:complete
MFVKIKIHFLLLIIGSLLVLLGAFLDNLLLGQVWYSLSPNSLVGFQKFVELLFNTEYFDNIVFFLLEFNLYFILAFLAILASLIIFILQD